MEMNRRELCALLPALVSTFSVPGESGISSFTITSEELKAKGKKTATGASHSIVKGAARTGEKIEAHETLLQPGMAPHAPHRHEHSEFWLIREGTVEITINGQGHRLGPGGVGFASSNDEHGIKNVGDVPATYFVVAVGPMK